MENDRMKRPVSGPASNENPEPWDTRIPTPRLWVSNVSRPVWLTPRLFRVYMALALVWTDGLNKKAGIFTALRKSSFFCT